jgi:hypothetical protein
MQLIIPRETAWLFLPPRKDFPVPAIPNPLFLIFAESIAL